MRGLQHIADGRMEPQLGPLPGVPAIDEHRAFRGLIEPAHQVHQSGFTCAGLADNGQMSTKGNFQREVLQHILFAVGIMEGHILKLNITLEGFPILLLGIKAVAVLFNDFGSILHIGPHGQQIGKTLNIDLGGNKVRNDIHQPPQWLHHTLGIGHEYGERTDLFLGNMAALPQHNSQRHRRCQIHGTGKQAPEPGCLDAFCPHGLRLFGKPGLHLVLDGQGLDSLGAGDAFVKVTGNAGIDLTNLPVDLDKLLLEEGKQDHQKGDNGQHHQGQLGIHDQHHKHHAYKIGDTPDAVYQCPGHEAADAGSIAHEPGMDVAHAILVEIGKRQGLQVLKTGLPQFLVHPHFNDHCQRAGNVVDYRLQDNGHQISNDEKNDGIKGTLADKVVQGIALVLGDHNIRHTAQQAKDHHHQHQPSYLFNVRQDLANAEEFQMFCLLILHYTVTSWEPLWVS